MPKKPILQLCYAMLITLTCFSFGTYILLEKFKAKTEIGDKDFTEENTAVEKETSTEFTHHYLLENLGVFNEAVLSAQQNFPYLSVKIIGLALQPSTPPPDLT